MSLKYNKSPSSPSQSLVIHSLNMYVQTQYCPAIIVHMYVYKLYLCICIHITDRHNLLIYNFPPMNNIFLILFKIRRAFSLMLTMHVCSLVDQRKKKNMWKKSADTEDQTTKLRLLDVSLVHLKEKFPNDSRKYGYRLNLKVYCMY